jgi:hypothetical protein
MFRVADNETPRPLDRVFFAVSSLREVDRHVRPPGAPELRVTRQMFGLEKTFLGGDASLELRVPFFQLHDAPRDSLSDFGNLTLLGKYWLIDHKASGLQTSVGLALTFATGPDQVDPVTGISLRTNVWQPFAATLWQHGDFYVQSFLSLAVPGDDRISTAVFCDFGVGYYFIRNLPGIRSAAAVLEAHKTKAFLDHGAAADPLIAIPSMTTANFGLHLEFRMPLLLSFGVGCPVSGFDAFDTHWMIQCNYRF